MININEWYLYCAAIATREITDLSSYITINKQWRHRDGILK